MQRESSLCCHPLSGTMASPMSPSYSPSGRSRVAPGISTVDLLDLAISALAASVAASQPIRKLAEQSDSGDEESADDTNGASPKAAGNGLQKDGSQKNVRTKLDGTVVTDADGAAQRIIVAALRHVSTDVRIVGEESRTEMEKSLSRDFEEAARRFLEMDVNGAGQEEDTTADQQEHKAAEEANEEDATVEHEIAGIFQMVREEITNHYYEAVARNMRIPDIGLGGGGGDGDNDDNDIGDATKAASRPQHRPTSSSCECQEQIKAGATTKTMISPRDRIIDSSRVSVLIDPLDGTSCYASGKHEYVTTLVAIVLDNMPIFGVICKPFGGHADEPCILNSGCFAVYGGALLDGIYVAGGDEIERSRLHRIREGKLSSCQLHQLSNGAVNGKERGGEDITTHARTSRQRAVISKSRAGGVVGKCIGALADEGLLHRDPVFVSGAGVKALHLLVGSQDECLWFFPKAGTSLWDVAAADALLRVVGGRLSDKFGKDIDYSKSRQDAENNDGIVACNDASLHSKCIRIYQEADWRDEE